MAVQVTYEWTKPLLRSALRLHRRRNAAVWYRRICLLVIADLTAAAVVFVWINSLFNKPAGAARDMLSVVLFVLVYALLAHLWPSLLVYQSWKTMFPPHISSRLVTIHLDDDAVQYSLPLVSEAKIRWSVICKIITNDDLTMLYLNKKNFLLIPKSALSSEDDAVFNELITRKAQNLKC